MSEEVRNELINQFDKQAITNDLKQELKSEIKGELNNLLSDKMKIENEIAYNLKRNGLIEDGKLEDEAFKKFIFKVT